MALRFANAIATPSSSPPSDSGSEVDSEEGHAAGDGTSRCIFSETPSSLFLRPTSTEVTPWALPCCRPFRREVQADSPCAPLWLRIPAEAWALAADHLSDRDVGVSAAAARCLSEAIGSQDQWSRRAARAVARLPGLTAEDITCVQAVVRNDGRSEYVLRRSLLKGLAITLTARPEASAIRDLAKWCGGVVWRPGKQCDLVLIGTGRGANAAVAFQRRGSCTSTLMASWLPASCVVGQRLPRHRPGCPSESSSFSLLRSCIAPSRGSSVDYRLCCYAPRLLEGLLVSTSRLGSTDRKAVESTVRALGGDCTEELTRSHTHLIAGAPQGAKFEFAMQHRIPVVSRAWLDQTVASGTPMKERFFSVGGRV
mmetsp:Transcript_37124/g.59797  ORF Transcript_37124/g.59797 Transcript_37124/m.59797 type:complete len:368 (-) Transcript_37124:83-1186(-)